MLFWTCQITIVSIILIFLVHHLINFFKTTLTVPKIKDLVNTSTQKYENMYNIISNKNDKSNITNFTNNTNSSNILDYTEIDLLPNPEPSSMKNELKNFLKKQLKNSQHTNEISSIDNIGSISYSQY